MLLAGQGHSPQILLDPKDSPSVIRAATDLAVDFGRVFGHNASLLFINATGMIPGTPSSALPMIIVGTIGSSDVIDHPIWSGKLDVSATQGQWESYMTQLVDNPVDGVETALVIAGSDRRGAIYSMYDISEQIGVSPLYWWGDVPVVKKNAIYALDQKTIQPPPSVKYRALFINNEGPAMEDYIIRNYPNQTFSPGVNAEFYENVFELILRLRANYLWPASWYSMFYEDDPRSAPLAEYYGVVMGTSHTEPMARATNEQSTFLNGTWDWLSNEENVKSFMTEGVARSRNWETVYTIGMRGLGDASSPTLNASVEEDIIAWQRDTLSDVLEQKNVSTVSQQIVLFDELGTYYQEGMKIPDDVVMMFPDNNAGNIMRLPISNETGPPGGAGLYYHFDMNAPPRSYKLINTIQLIKTWEQLSLTYSHAAREIWVGNIGDIKDLELPLNHFFDMAYDMDAFSSVNSTYQWLQAWATQQFGSKAANETASILTDYGQLIIRLKYEELSKSPYYYSVLYYDEADRNIQEWEQIAARAQNVYNSLDPATQISYFEMVLQPALAGFVVENLYYRNAMNKLYATQGRASSSDMGFAVVAAFQEDAAITERFNKLLGGKWIGYMVQPHIGYTSWDDPPDNIIPNVTYISASEAAKTQLGVAVQGGKFTLNGTVEAIAMDPYMSPSDTRYLEVYAAQNGSFLYSIKSNASFVSVSPATGKVSSPGGHDARVNISVDWSSAPKGLSWVSLDVSQAQSNKTVNVLLPVNRTSLPDNFKGFVESNGVVSIEAEHFDSSTSSSSAKWMVIPAYGRTLSGITLAPNTCPPQSLSSGPSATYNFHTFTSSLNVTITVYSGPSMNFDPLNPLKWAVAVDDKSPVTVQVVADYVLGPPPGGQNAVEGIWTNQASFPIESGTHNLKLWSLVPGLIIEKVVIDVGGLLQSFLGPPESFVQ